MLLVSFLLLKPAWTEEVEGLSLRKVVDQKGHYNAGEL
jgi:hypothetical protein